MDAPVESLTVCLPDDARAVVEASVAAGEFETATEAVTHAVRMWREVREEDPLPLHEMRRRVQDSLGDPRPSVPAEEVFARLEARSRARPRDV